LDCTTKKQGEYKCESKQVYLCDGGVWMTGIQCPDACSNEGVCSTAKDIASCCKKKNACSAELNGKYMCEAEQVYKCDSGVWSTIRVCSESCLKEGDLCSDPNNIESCCAKEKCILKSVTTAVQGWEVRIREPVEIKGRTEVLVYWTNKDSGIKDVSDKIEVFEDTVCPKQAQGVGSS
jgi:hypothetical protein